MIKTYRLFIKSIKLFILFLFFIDFSYGQTHFNSSNEKIRYYKERYKVQNAYEKITDNHGNGFESLYGTRNMRVILFGVAYRGGANNYYHKTNKRDNKNPLPADGIMNLSKEGFSTAVYLYNTNYNDSLQLFVNENSKDTLWYLQNSLNSRAKIRELMLLVKSAIDNPQKGPIYLHCWNGWHQSGFSAALILMQFCKITNEQALEYWRLNTDGLFEGYEHIEKRIYEFRPFDDINISDSTRMQICPCLK